jgi:hypothetical protein
MNRTESVAHVGTEFQGLSSRHSPLVELFIAVVGGSLVPLYSAHEECVAL